MEDLTIKNLNDALTARYIFNHPQEAAQALDQFNSEETKRITQGSSNLEISKVLTFMSTEKASAYLLTLDEKKLNSILLEIDHMRAANLIEQLSEDEQASLFSRLSNTTVEEFKDLMRYPSDSAGKLMDTTAFTFKEQSTVKMVLDKIKKVAGRKIYDVFVVSADGKLIGRVPIQDLATHSDDTQLQTLMRANPPSVNPLSPKEVVVECFEKYKVTSLPVVHLDGYVLGVIRHDALVESSQDEATSDLVEMVGASPEEKALSTPVFAVKNRLPWLAINLGTVFAASAVVGLFEGTIAKVTALAVLLPVVAGQSGNTGAQAMAVTMRALALREIRPRHWLKVLFKELGAGFLNGVAIAVATSVCVYIWNKNWALSVVIGVSMILAMMIASLSGASVPIILTAMGRDPAQSSSIILTTITDILGFFVFLGLATIFMSQLA